MYLIWKKIYKKILPSLAGEKVNSNSLFLPPDRHMVNQIPGDLVNETGDLHNSFFGRHW